MLLKPVFDPSGGAVRLAGRLEVPRMGLSVVVVDGNESEGLEVGALRLADSAPFGSAGNTVIAGHRDVAFWPLRKIALGDQIQVRAGKTFRYTVRSIRVVTPETVSVLSNHSKPTLTLVTCYPFRFVGSAPQRFVVQADLQRP